MKVLIYYMLLVSLMGFSSVSFAQDENQSASQTISRADQVKAYKGIYQKLKRNYPDLTAEELKQAADNFWYQKMQLDHEQMSSGNKKLDNVIQDTSFTSQY